MLGRLKERLYGKPVSLHRCFRRNGRISPTGKATKEQLDKVQNAADALVHKADKTKSAG